jgi:hypothetical protein
VSSYTATIVCEKCHTLLAQIKSSHHGQKDVFVPQDIHERVIEAEWIYCDKCLNSFVMPDGCKINDTSSQGVRE